MVGLGTWQFGSREWAYGASYARDTAPAIVRRAIELGVTLVDTAEIYGFGRSERIIGQAIAGQRDAVVLATKLVPVLPLSSVVDWQVRGSLRRLDVDAIDLYQVHFPNPLVSPRSTVAPLRTLLTGQDGFSPDQARGFQATPQAYQFGVCATAIVDPYCTADPGTVPKAVDVITPTGVNQSTELDYTLGAVVIEGVVIP